MTESNEIPDDAMFVENGLESNNYVRFTTTDVIEWYTERTNGEVTSEKFVANDSTHPEDIPLGLRI